MSSKLEPGSRRSQMRCTDGMPVITVHCRLIIHRNYCSLHARFQKPYFRTHRKSILGLPLHFFEIIARSMRGVTTVLLILYCCGKPLTLTLRTELGPWKSSQLTNESGTSARK
jgi:hypothetical protein